jgi:uncharacterized protein DUF551
MEKKTAIEVLSTYHPVKHDMELRTDLWPDKTILMAMEEYADQFKPQWVKVRERLPELEITVMLFDDWKSNDGTEYKDIRVGHLAYYTTIKSKEGVSHIPEWGGTEYSFNITHWMPLPTLSKT